MFTKKQKYILGVLYFWPLFYIGLFTVLSLSFSEIKPSVGPEQLQTPILIHSLNIFTYLCIIGTLIFSIFLLFRNSTVGLIKKVLIIFLLIIGNIFMLPFFWYLFILHEE